MQLTAVTAARYWVVRRLRSIGVVAGGASPWRSEPRAGSLDGGGQAAGGSPGPPPPNVVKGGLMSYGPNPLEYWRGGAVYVAKILKGANPGELPVAQATRYDLTINMKTAKSLGLTIPP